MLNSTPMPNISTNVELSTVAPLLPNPCYRQFLFVRQPKVDCKSEHQNGFYIAPSQSEFWCNSFTIVCFAFHF